MKAPQPSTRSSQRIYPLFVLSFALLSIGMYLGFQASARGAVEDHEDPLAIPADVTIDESILLREGVAPVDLRYGQAPAQSFELTMRQVNTYASPESGERRLETRLGLTWTDTTTGGPGPDDSLNIQREFGNARVDVLEDDRRVGADITRQLELLVAGARQSIAMNPRGMVDSFEWDSDTNPQVQQTLSLIHDATRLLTPHFQREPINVGEDWTYRVPAEVRATETPFEARGAMTVANRLEGLVEHEGTRLAVISQRFDLEMTGSHTPEHKFGAQANGKGIVYFDIEAGLIYKSRVDLERTMQIGGPDTLDVPHTSQIELHLQRRVSGD